MSTSPILIETSKIRSRSALAFATGIQFRDQDLQYVSLSGIALADHQGNSESKWNPGTYLLQFKIPIQQLKLPPTPDGDAYVPIFHIKHWTVYAGLNAVLNIATSNSSGHAVEAFHLVKPASGFYITHDEVQIQCELASRDTDAFLHRIACQVELLLYFIGYAARTN